MEAGDIASVQQDRVNIMRLRSSLDLCSEELPILLELGQVGDLIKQDYNFPYHVPSLISLATASSSQMPETIGYCLLQVGDAWLKKKKFWCSFAIKFLGSYSETFSSNCKSKNKFAGLSYYV